MPVFSLIKLNWPEAPPPRSVMAGRVMFGAAIVNVLVLSTPTVESVSSVGLGKLIGLHKRVRAAGGLLTLCNVTPFVHEVLEVTRLTTLLDVLRRGQEAGAA